jgi:SLOG family YspA-like protein
MLVNGRIEARRASTKTPERSSAVTDAPNLLNMKIAVVGSRSFKNLDAVRQFVFEQERTTVIVSGGASGVDSVAVSEARRLRMPYEVHLPDWNRHGRSAGPIRNREIIDAAFPRFVLYTILWLIVLASV